MGQTGPSCQKWIQIIRNWSRLRNESEMSQNHQKLARLSEMGRAGKNVYFPGRMQIFPQFVVCFYMQKDQISHQIPKFPTKLQHLPGRSFPISIFFYHHGNVSKSSCSRLSEMGLNRSEMGQKIIVKNMVRFSEMGSQMI